MDPLGGDDDDEDDADDDDGESGLDAIREELTTRWKARKLPTNAQAPASTQAPANARPGPTLHSIAQSSSESEDVGPIPHKRHPTSDSISLPAPKKPRTEDSPTHASANGGTAPARKPQKSPSTPRRLPWSARQKSESARQGSAASYPPMNLQGSPSLPIDLTQDVDMHPTDTLATRTPSPALPGETDHVQARLSPTPNGQSVPGRDPDTNREEDSDETEDEAGEGQPEKNGVEHRNEGERALKQEDKRGDEDNEDEEATQAAAVEEPPASTAPLDSQNSDASYRPGRADNQRHETPPAIDAFSRKVSGVFDLADAHGNDTTLALVSALYTSSQFSTDSPQKQRVFSPEEDALIKHLKEHLNMKWEEIQSFFPHRTGWQTIQSHYSNKVKTRASNSHGPAHSLIPPSERQIQPDAFPAPQAAPSWSQPAPIPPQPSPTSSQPAPKPAPRPSQPAPTSSMPAHRTQLPSRPLGQHFDAAATWLPRPTLTPATSTPISTPQQALSEDAQTYTQQIPTMDEPRRSTRLAGSYVPGRFYIPPPVETQLDESQSTQDVSEAIEPSPQDDRTALPAVAEARSAANDITAKLWLRNKVSRRTPNEHAFETDRDIIAARHDRDLAATSSMTLKIHRRAKKSIDIARPYLSPREHRYLDANPGVWSATTTPKDWTGAVVHVDFIEEEQRKVLAAVEKVLPPAYPRNPSLSTLEHITGALQGAAERDVPHIASEVIRHEPFINRAFDDIEQFLWDAMYGEVSARTRSRTLQMSTSQKRNRRLRQRELGRVAATGRIECEFEAMAPALHFVGTSSDVNVVSWAPDGTKFAVGSAALTDESSMQYNRPNNLLFGDLVDSSVRELVQHTTLRQPRAGVNARPEMVASQDPLLFHSISAAQFMPVGGGGGRSVLITAGYDKKAVAWKCGNGTPKAVLAFPHTSPIDVLAVNSQRLFATGAKVVRGRPVPGVRVFRYALDDDDGDGDERDTEPYGNGDAFKVAKFNSQKPNVEMEPSCLQFGPAFGALENFLLAGFCSSQRDYGPGEVNVWDVNRPDAAAPVASLQPANVFDAVWDPFYVGHFAVACTRNSHSNVARDVRSLVRLHDLRRRPDGRVECSRTCLREFDCPALDVNDLVFSPTDPNVLGVGCTDGRVYLWDRRRSDDPVHVLEHAPTLTVHRRDEDLEQVDTGVRFLSWGERGRYLYSGSSDGVVAEWDHRRSPEDAYIRDVVRLETGVMSGAFSPDFSNLLLGDIQGSVSLLSAGGGGGGQRAGVSGSSMRSAESFVYHEAKEEKERLRRRYGQTPASELPEAAAAAQQLVDSGQVVIRPLGNLPIRQAVQGPAYEPPLGPPTAETLEMRALAEQFQDEMRLREREPRCRCETSTPLLTEEELGDSGAWKQRIPGALRYEDKKPQGFACLRCSNDLLRQDRPQRLDTSLTDDLLVCTICKGEWQADVLGYRSLTQSTAGRNNRTLRENTNVDDETNDLHMDDWDAYHSAWGQRDG